MHNKEVGMVKNSSKIGEEKFKKIVEEALQGTPTQESELPKQAEQPRDWKDLQVKVKEIYEDLGCEVKEDVQVKGVRTKHKIDVLALFEFAGQKYRIVIECKYWSTKIKKAQVSSLIGILVDIGAEKGVIVTKEGFQSGAHRLASYTNIDLLTFDELKKNSELFIEKVKIHNALDRIRSIRIPFVKFQWKMKEETEKKNLWWVPSTRGLAFLGSLSILEGHIELLDLLTFPRRYIYALISDKKKELSKVANNRREFLDLILDNLTILEKEYEEFKEEIFSE